MPSTIVCAPCWHNESQIALTWACGGEVKGGCVRLLGLKHADAKAMPGLDREQKRIKRDQGFTAGTLFNAISDAEIVPQHTLKSLSRLQGFPVTVYLCVYFKSEVLLYVFPKGCVVFWKIRLIIRIWTRKAGFSPSMTPPPTISFYPEHLRSYVVMLQLPNNPQLIKCVVSVINFFTSWTEMFSARKAKVDVFVLIYSLCVSVTLSAANS